MKERKKMKINWIGGWWFWVEVFIDLVMHEASKNTEIMTLTHKPTLCQFEMHKKCWEKKKAIYFNIIKKKINKFQFSSIIESIDLSI